MKTYKEFVMVEDMEQVSIKISKRARAYLLATWHANGADGVMKPKPGLALRKIIEAALNGEFPVVTGDFECSRTEAASFLISKEDHSRLKNNPLNVGMSTYVALALASYMALHPIPEEVLEKYIEPNKSQTPSSSVSDQLAQKDARITTLESQLATASETIAHLVEILHNATRNTPTTQQTLEGA
jgi:hypothetical protein